MCDDENELMKNIRKLMMKNENAVHPPFSDEGRRRRRSIPRLIIGAQHNLVISSRKLVVLAHPPRALQLLAEADDDCELHIRISAADND
ncbi:hypothetical protein niasHT_020438 [Heterodera trifolii]|uniref:Uncharacterized protein n=1 Tax=Heterodera trifolii TaxID=157864 RepID=A0ABD2JGC9_9BILA